MTIRPKLIITDDGPVVVNLLRRRLRWDDIAAVVVDERIGGPMLAFHLRNGRRVRSWDVTVGSMGVAYEWVESTAAYVAERRRVASGRPSPVRPATSHWPELPPRGRSGAEPPPRRQGAAEALRLLAYDAFGQAAVRAGRSQDADVHARIAYLDGLRDRWTGLAVVSSLLSLPLVTASNRMEPSVSHWIFITCCALVAFCLSRSITLTWHKQCAKRARRRARAGRPDAVWMRRSRPGLTSFLFQLATAAAPALVIPP